MPISSEIIFVFSRYAVAFFGDIQGQSNKDFIFEFREDGLAVSLIRRQNTRGSFPVDGYGIKVTGADTLGTTYAKLLIYKGLLSLWLWLWLSEAAPWPSWLIGSQTTALWLIGMALIGQTAIQQPQAGIFPQWMPGLSEEC